MPYDVVIVGAGLAGASAAYSLSGSRSVLVLEAQEPAAGASGSATGLVNPFMGRRARPAWKMDEALDALDWLVDAARIPSLYRKTGVFRAAASEEHVQYFRQTAERHPDGAHWLSPRAVIDRYPDVRALLGGLWVPRAGSLPIPALVRGLLDAAQARGAVLRYGIHIESFAPIVRTTGGEEIETALTILALGAGYRSFPSLGSLPLHVIKGQTIYVDAPAQLPSDLPALSGTTYIVPRDDKLAIGATFEHTFTDEKPDPRQSEELLARAADLLPMLANARVAEARAGLRVTVPRVRLPLLTPLPHVPKTWVFTALGAKGLLTAPLLARMLPEALSEPTILPDEVRLTG